MKRGFFSFAFVIALAGCGGRTSNAVAGSTSSGTMYGRVWVTNAVAEQPAELLAEFAGPAPVSSSRNPVFGACYGTTTGTAAGYQSAGTLELYGTGGPWLLAPDSTNTYRATPSVSWPPGSLLTIQASGGDVPAFTGTFVVPPALVYTNGRVELMAALSGEGDIVLNWKPIDAENIWVGVQAASAEVSCSFNSEDGTGTIPAAALATLPASGRSISSVANNSNSLQLGNWWINLIAQSRAQLADGSLL